MKTEEMQKDAKLFNNDKECYVHFQRSKNTPYTCIISGDFYVIIQGLYHLINTICSEYEVPFNKIIKAIRKGKRIIKESETIKEELF